MVGLLLSAAGIVAGTSLGKIKSSAVNALILIALVTVITSTTLITAYRPDASFYISLKLITSSTKILTSLVG